MARPPAGEEGPVPFHDATCIVLTRYLEQQLRHPLPQLTTAQKTIVAAVFIIAAGSRFAAISRSLSDWDETLFCWGIRDYDVSRDHPHAPGYPVFIVVARLLRQLSGSEFQALQSANVIAAVLLFSAALMFARELRLPFRAALTGSTLLVFGVGSAAPRRKKQPRIPCRCAACRRCCRNPSDQHPGHCGAGTTRGCRRTVATHVCRRLHAAGLMTVGFYVGHRGGRCRGSLE